MIAAASTTFAPWKQVALIAAAQDAETKAVELTVRAKAEKEAAEMQAAVIGSRVTHISWGRVFHLVRYSYFPETGLRL